MKQVIVTGASSPIGEAFIRYCVQQNVKVVALLRAHSPRQQAIPKHPLVEQVEFSLDQPFPLIKMEKDAVFYHFAWKGTNKIERLDAHIQAENIESTLKLMDWAHQIGCTTFIGAGSQAEYGRVDGVITPQSPCNPDIAYGVAKYSAGILGRIHAQKLGLRFIWTRIFSVYSPWEPEYSIIGSLTRCILSNQEISLTACEQIWDFLYADDAAQAFYLLGKKGVASKIYHIASGQAQPLLHFINVIKENVSNPALIKVGAIPYSNLQVMSLRPDISELVKDTGFTPKALFKDSFEKVLNSIKQREFYEKN
ncbi:MAG: NAD-dependent epimerase/dehydratase family protein [Brevinema sp.]